MTDVFNAGLSEHASVGAVRLEAFLPEGSYESTRDRRLAKRFLRRFAGALIEVAINRLQEEAGRTGATISRPEGSFGPFRYVLRERLTRGVVEIVWYAGDRRRLWRQIAPVISEVEFSAGSLWARTKLIGGWFVVVIAGTIVGEGYKDSEPGKAAVEASTRAFNAMNEAVLEAGDIAATVAKDLNVRATVTVDGDVVTITIERGARDDKAVSRRNGR